MMMKRFLSILLGAILVLSLLHPAAAQTVRTGGADFYDRVADASTLDSWMTLFGPDVNSTVNVGTVWTDKTVSTTTPSGYNYSMEDSNTNFMVTLSTLSATMSITGHETLPTDTVFVLDLSSSMYNNIKDQNGNTLSPASANPTVVQQMINAVNIAIDRLLKLNPLNRVGVVIYYGNAWISPQSNTSHFTPLLQLDSFEELDSCDYLVMDKNGNQLSGISINANLKTRNQQAATSEPYVMKYYTQGSNTAGTYIQLGIKEALEMLLSADSTVPADSEFQAGATRIPIMILMSDGEPTAADHEYSVINEATMGNNSTIERSPAETDFLTQLTAAMARELMDMHYAETTPLFYTLGLGSKISKDVMEPYTDTSASSSGYTVETGRDFEYYENSPEQINARIQEYWEALVPENGSIPEMEYLKGTASVTFSKDKTSVSKVSSYTTQNNKTFSFEKKFPWSLDQKYYVDKYFSANTANDLAAAFSSLVDEIILQSAYYPTYVENGAIGMSGYVDFHDEIGDMMEVKAVHGLARKANSREIANINNLPDAEKNKINIDNNNIIYYKGEQIARYVQDRINGNGTELANVKALMTELIQKRLGIPENAAEQIINTIIEKNNTTTPIIYWQSDADYSNAFSWYATEDETFIALDVGQAMPPNTAYRITTYWYASPYDLENTNSFIRIKRELSSGKECVTWSVPASMIPLVKYEVDLQSDSLQTPGDITVTYKDNYPMRAFFEVGLRSDVNKYNAVEKLKELGYQADNGKYTFFSNQWAATKTNPSSDPTQLHSAGNTVSTFRPSEQNERYYVTADSPLYVLQDEEYVAYTGSKPTTGNGYYVKVPVFTKGTDNWGDQNKAALTWEYTALPNTDIKTVQVDNYWYADIRTVKNPGPSSIAKEKNVTNSFPDSTYESQRDETYVTSILGNNGTFHFTADTGIEITKTVNSTSEDDKTKEFTFVIEAAEDTTKLTGAYTVNYHKDGEQISDRTTSITADTDGKLTVPLKHGESAYIAGSLIDNAATRGLPKGRYKITEQIVGVDGSYFFEVTGLTVNGQTQTPANSVTVDVSQFGVTEVAYANKPVDTGAIEISKTVTGDSAPADAQFTFDVQLDAAHHGNRTVKKSLNGEAEETLLVPADGKLTVTIKAGDTLRISDLAADENVFVSVRETNLPNGFSVTGDLSLTKEVRSNSTAEFEFTNTFTPASITFSGTKTLTGRDMTENDKFTFELYETDSTYAVAEDKQPLQSVQNVVDAVTKANTFTFQSIQYNEAKIYYYVVKELIPAETDQLPGVAYDSKVYNIQVDVTTEDVVDGTTNKGTKLVATVKLADSTALDSSKLEFTNSYTPAAITVPLSGMKTLDGLTLGEDQFSFSLYKADANFTKGDLVETVKNDATGKFAFESLSYSTITTQPVTYYYLVEEDFAESTAIPGLEYDETVYQVAVTISYSQASGAFSQETAIRKVTKATSEGEQDTITTGIAADALNFTNVYEAVAGGVTLSGIKTLSAVPTQTAIQLQGEEFTFGLYPASVDESNQWIISGDVLQTVTNDKDGKFAFSRLDYNEDDTYYYIIKEVWDDTTKRPGVSYDETEYHVTVVVTDEDAALTPVVTVVPPASTFAAVRPEPVIVPYTALNFTNTYDAEDTSVTLSGTKALTVPAGLNRALEAGEFTFELYDNEGKLIESVTNAEGGTFTFTKLDYTEPGTYHYVVKEASGNKPGVAYDTTVYNIQVVVEDTAEAKLKATVSGIPEGGLTFTNTYAAVEAAAVFSGTKTLVGRPLKENEFSFTLYKAEMTDTGLQIGEAIQTVTNDANGNYAFPQPQNYPQEGTYYYIVKEDQGNLPGVTYDQTQYYITVTVADVGAVLTPTSTTVAVMPLMPLALTDDSITLGVTDLNFTNTYDATDTSVTFSGTKTLSGRRMEAGEFTFTLYQADGDYTPVTAMETVANTADGAFAFAPIPYDATGTYYYLVREEQGPLADMTYDATEYRIQVVVADVNAQLVATVTVTTPDPLSAGMEAPTANTLTFHNAHDETDTAVRFSGTKTLTGRSLAKGDFTFTLYSADTAFTPLTSLQTATNAADGSFAFRPIVFSRTGAYYFVVREDAGSQPGVTYDGTEYRIFVEVWNNNGVLVANVTANRILGGETTQVNPTDGLAFANHYVPASVAVPFSGQKVYQGAELQSGMFTFHLYAADEHFNPVGAPLDSAVNAIDGSFAFSKRAFHSPGVYRFLVMEDASLPLPHVTYDPTVYQLTVTVTDNGMGSLVASTSITAGDGLAAESPVFENFYFEVPETGDHSALGALLALCLLSLTALTALVVSGRRRARS